MAFLGVIVNDWPILVYILFLFTISTSGCYVYLRTFVRVYDRWLPVGILVNIYYEMC